VSSFRVFGIAARPQALPPANPPPGFGFSFRACGLLRYRPHGFCDPTMPSAIPSAPWCSRNRLRRSQSSSRSNALVEFRHPLKYLPAKPSQPAEADQHLSWTFAPYSTSRIHGSTHAGFACPLRSALRVWPPSRRLAPREPAPALFHADSAPGIHPSKPSPLERYPNVPARKRPPTVSLAAIPTAEATGRTGEPRFLGFDPSESPLRPKRVFSTPAAGCSPGFRPSWANQPKPWPGFRPASSYALRSSNDARPSHRCPRVSISLDLIPSARRASTTNGWNNPLRVSAPAQSLAFR
jgi:hypothetical protein